MQNHSFLFSINKYASFSSPHFLFRSNSNHSHNANFRFHLPTIHPFSLVCHISLLYFHSATHITITGFNSNLIYLRGFFSLPDSHVYFFSSLILIPDSICWHSSLPHWTNLILSAYSFGCECLLPPFRCLEHLNTYTKKMKN